MSPQVFDQPPDCRNADGVEHRQRVPVPPRLRPIEQTIFVLLSNAGRWVLVDEWEHPSHREVWQTDITAALYRRGFDVVRRSVDGRCVQAFARWPHEVPSGVAA